MPHAIRNSSLILASGGLAIAFERAGDRYRHQIALEEGNEKIVLLESVEGSAEEAWPPSPPLQEIEMRDGDGETPVALLVGMAGRSHWSASVELVAERREAVFDIACRADRCPVRLGTSYRLNSDVDVRIEDQSVALRHRCGEIQLDLRGDMAAATSRFSHQGEVLTVQVVPADGRFPSTTRWSYAVIRK